MEHPGAPRQPPADQASLPEGWVQLRSKAGETFFHHFETGTCRVFPQILSPSMYSSLYLSKYLCLLRNALNYTSNFSVYK